MASYLGTEFQRTPVQSAINAPLIQTVLAMKQGQFDAVKEGTQKALDQMGQIAVRRPQDQEYINQKINNLTDQLNSTVGSKNLADPSVSDSIHRAIISVARDPFVLNAIEQTKKLSNFDLQVDELKKKKPELYSDINYGYSLHQAGVDAYDRGETNKIGNLNYTPYTDLTKTHLDKLKIVKDLKGKRFVETRDNNGTIQRKEIDGMTNQEIQEYFNGILTPEEMTQLKINGWAKFKDDEVGARADFEKYNKGLSTHYDNEITRLKEKSNNTSLTQQEREDAKRELESAKTAKAMADENISLKDSLSIDNIGLMLEKASYTSSIANIASSEWSYEYKLDPIWKAKEDFKYQAEDLALKKNKDRREEAEFVLKMAKEANLNSDGTPRTSVSSRRDELPEDVSGIKTMEEQSKEQFDIVINTTKDLLKNLNGAQKGQFIAELKKRGVDENFNKIGTGRVIITDAIVDAFDATGLGAYSEYAKTIKNAAAQKDAIATDIVKVKSKSYFEEYKTDTDGYLNKLFDLYKYSSKVSTDAAMEKLSTLYKNVTGKTLSKKDLASVEFGGGAIDKIKQELKKELDKDSTKAIPFSEGMEDLYSHAKSNRLINTTIFGTTLKQASQERVENTLSKYSSDGSISTFTTYNNVNILNEKDKNDIIKMIPQDRIEGANFNPKLGMSVRYGKDGQIELVQYQGEEKNVGGGKSPKYAKFSFDKGDAVYERLQQFIQIEQDKKRPQGFNANSFTQLKPSSPRLNTSNKADEISDIRTVNNVKEQVELNPNIAKSFTVGTPRYWATASSIKTNLKAVLQDDLDKNTLDAFVNTYVQNINQFTLQPYTLDNPMTSKLNDKVWGFKIVNPKGTVIGEKLLGVTTLDPETKYLMDYQPQTYITEFVYQQLKQDKDFLNTIFN